MKKRFKEEKGFAIQDASIAVIFIIMFVGIISVGLTNAFKLTLEIKKEAIATNYFVNCVERLKAFNGGLIENTDVDNIINGLGLPADNEYEISYVISNPNYGTEQLYKNIRLELKYSVDNQDKRIRANIQVANRPAIMP